MTGEAGPALPCLGGGGRGGGQHQWEKPVCSLAACAWRPGRRKLPLARGLEGPCPVPHPPPPPPIPVRAADAWHNMHKIAIDEKQTLRQAAYLLAVKRVVRAEENRGFD